MVSSDPAWAEALAQDVDRRAAIILSLPHDFEPWPEGVDYYAEFEVHLRRYVVESVSSVVEIEQAERTRVTPYHVGPMAQSYPMCLVTFVQDVMPILSNVETLISLALLARAALYGVRRWHADAQHRLPRSQDPYRRGGPAVMLSEPLIVGLCYEHFESTHMRDGDRVQIDRSFRNDPSGYSSAGHPGGMGHYAIRIWTGRISFLYVVDCYGKPLDHLLLRGREMKQIVLPNWFDEQLSPYQPIPMVRSDVVHRSLNGR